MLAKLKRWASALKRDVLALYIAARDPRTPWMARTIALVVTAYALSPIDLIPDFIPIIGLLDDLLIVPAGIWLVLRLLPDGLVDSYRKQALEMTSKPRSMWGAALVLIAWALVLVALAAWFHA